MKKLFLVILLSTLGASAVSIAVPRGQTWRPFRNLHQVEDSRNLKAGDIVGQVCLNCNTVSTIKIESNEDGAKLFEEGATIECPTCRNKARASRGGFGPESGRGAVLFLNEFGKESMFLIHIDKSLNRGADTPHRFKS